MTQEELDALMASDINNLDEVEENSNEESEQNVVEENDNKKEEVYPPPADEKHKVVAQLDEVTKESEEKATQILDIMDNISSSMAETVEELNDVMKFLEHEKELFTKLSNAFAHIKTFKDELNRINEMIEKVQKAIESGEATQDEIMMAMDIMQYQDIHRQKIERVINIMRALIKYMNRLFEGKIDDTKRVKSATHIHGDENDEVVDEDDIEALIAQFGGGN
jgi:DNA repair exonuclease SbcCD ATPase subunit